ncbi:MAG: hydantoinase B/oxoprolinase family protein [Deltaproteobacteria bacterium]|nr:hydantoinase B/oxoprolinase family protein [Deltaproteobacteria bacterium]
MDVLTKSVDAITFEILSHRLHQIAKETGITLERVGGTVNTTQMHDYAAALYRASGEILSAGETTGWHVACAGEAVKRIIERFDKEGEIYPDDIFILNDPYLAAIHQSDLYMVCPIHFKEKLVGWSGTFVHVMDIGAMSPGGGSPGATEIFHEGLRIPGLKLVERGKLRRDVFDTLTHMTRQPVMVGLDLKCQMAANNVAKSRMIEMYAQYGPELVDGVSGAMIRYSESVLRRRIAEIADGSWDQSGMIQGEENWKITVRLTKRDDRLIFDFTGTDKQARRGINLPCHATFGACFRVVLFTLAYDIPKNHGVLRPIEVVAPGGTIVNVQYPGPVSLNTTSSGSMVRYLASSVLMQALATSEKWKQEVMAISAGHRNVRHAGVNQYGRYSVSALGHGALDGTGARSYQDGVNSWGGHLSCANVEWFEMNFPILYLFRRHARDAAGAGKFRGGAGAETAHTLHDAPEGRVKGITYGVSGLRNSGQGVFGGYPGAPSIILHLEETKIHEMIGNNELLQDINHLGVQAKPLAYKEFDFKKNDVLYMRMASGGGYGDPLERDPQLVLEDVADGIVSRKTARDMYGVLLDEKGQAIDWAGTKAFRASLFEERLRLDE